MKSNILIIALVIINATCIAQDKTSLSTTANEFSSKDFKITEDMWESSAEIGFNSTQFIRQFIPFNLGQLQPGFTSVRGKWYGSEFAFRMSFAADIINGGNGTQQFYGSLGYERRKIIGNRWCYTRGWDAFLGNNLFEIRNSGGFGESLSIGIDRHWGIEYHINPHMYLSTETQLMFGFNQGAALRVVYPISLLFNVRL
jgi:hypothetical protein